MKLLHLSDTHGKHRQLGTLPTADILVHSGDFSQEGSENEILDFLNWCCDLPHAHKVIVPGNHDVGLYGLKHIEGLPNNVHLLCNAGAEIMGLKFHGLPMFVPDILSGAYSRFIENIPADTDILVSHEPPLGILDTPTGQHLKPHPGSLGSPDSLGSPGSLGSPDSPALAKRVLEIRPRYHLFGHEHDAYGVLKQGGTVFSNAALLDRHGVLQRAPRLFILD